MEKNQLNANFKVLAVAKLFNLWVIYLNHFMNEGNCIINL